MIVVKVELHSAITGKVTEIGRALIVNDGTGTKDRGNYTINIMRKGSKNIVQKQSVVKNYPRLSYPVWELIRRALGGKVIVDEV